MKKGILFLFILASLTTRAQSLKELLYSGKLKSDSNSVVRKTDDLSTKIDTAQKKPAEVKTTVVIIPADSMTKSATAANQNNATQNKTTDVSTNANVVADPAAVVVATDAVAAPPPPAAKTNTKLWKEYTDAFSKTLLAEVMNSKKIKKGTYNFTVEYELDPTGKVNVTNVTVLPENALLASQVKDRIESNPPQLNADPNQTKVLKKRQNFYVTKD
jgi:uncharacterized protein (DUF1697 family)